MGIGTVAGLLTLVLAGCAAPAPASRSPGAGEALTLVLLVNRSGREVRIRARADGRELFDETLPAHPDASGTTVKPAPDSLPTRELKVVLPTGARALEVEEPASRRTARVDIQSAGAPWLGFRVIVDADGLAVTRDYYPRR
jgi:hypothetical protein